VLEVELLFVLWVLASRQELPVLLQVELARQVLPRVLLQVELARQGQPGGEVRTVAVVEEVVFGLAGKNQVEDLDCNTLEEEDLDYSILEGVEVLGYNILEVVEDLDYNILEVVEDLGYNTLEVVEVLDYNILEEVEDLGYNILEVVEVLDYNILEGVEDLGYSNLEVVEVLDYNILEVVEGPVGNLGRNRDFEMEGVGVRLAELVSPQREQQEQQEQQEQLVQVQVIFVGEWRTFSQQVGELLSEAEMKACSHLSQLSLTEA
jgi:hypothetical protein